MADGNTVHGGMVPSVPIEGLEEAIRDFLESACGQDLRIATAESCTGGLLASLITDINGFSHAFDRGFVTYSSAAKEDQLGVLRDLLKREGAVSRPVAVAMAEGALKRSNAHLAMAITGFAGPAGEEHEEGLVHFACARTGRETRHAEKHFGAIGRDAIRAGCMAVAVEMMRAMVDEDNG